MHLNVALLLCFGLWQAVVRAGPEVRGIEILLYYQAYRLDVEVSSRIATDAGKDPDKSWKIARSAVNTESDFANGQIDTSKPGANFHAFASATASMGYAKAEGLTRISDPWNPTWQEVKDIVHWEPIPQGSQYSYGGFDVKTMLGALAGDEPNAVPGQDGKPTKNLFFELDKILAIIGQYSADLYDEEPDIAEPYMETLSELLELATEGGEKESAGSKADNFKDALAKKNQQFNPENPKSITDAVKTKLRQSANFGTYLVVSLRDTARELQKRAGKNAPEFIKLMKDIGKAYKLAETADDMDEIKKIQNLDSQTKDRLRVFRQQLRLAEAIKLHVGGKPIAACNYPGVG